ncbi:MAG: hypothetical protein IJX10_00225 [Phascolarctobacterium sp.]|nr:hypothetical protein [Phascolarctobacterium sp.]
MDFGKDLANISKKILKQKGITISNEWDDYHIVMNFLEIQRRWLFDSKVPCEVKVSKQLSGKISTLTPLELQVYNDIVSRMKNGQPLEPYMSRLIYNTKVSKSDFLLKNWNIYHLHLETVGKNNKFEGKSSNLLFFQPKDNVLHLIDIKPHPRGCTWFDRDLLEIIFDNWPSLLRYEKGMKPTISVPDKEVHDGLKNMVMIIDFHDGMLFPTNLGVASSGDSSWAVLLTNRIFNSFRIAEKELSEHEEKIKLEIFNQTHIYPKHRLDYVLRIVNDDFYAYEYRVKKNIFLFSLKEF